MCVKRNSSTGYDTQLHADGHLYRTLHSLQQVQAREVYVADLVYAMGNDGLIWQ